jgi:hypothetical protein
MDLLLIYNTLIINSFPVPTALLFGSQGRDGVETNSAVQVCAPAFSNNGLVRSLYSPLFVLSQLVLTLNRHLVLFYS